MGLGQILRRLILTLGVVAIGQTAPALQAWSYYKLDVQDFLTGWRTQIEQDQKLPSREKDLRTDLINHLLAKVDASYHGDRLNELIIDDCMDNHQPLLAKAIQEVMEPTENLLLFMRSFVEFASLTNPPPDLEDFILSRSYTNTVEFEAATDALDADQAGQAAADFEELKTLEFDSLQNSAEQN